MDIKVEDIVKDVRVVIDEIAQNDSGFLSSQDETELDTIIKGRLCEAVDFVHSSAALDLMGGDVAERENCSVSGLSVNNMLRFVIGFCNGWSKSVNEVLLDGTEEYAMATDEYVGASNQRPAALVDFNGAGKTLYLIPNDGSGYVVYIKKCSVKTNTTTETPYDYVEIDSLMKDSVVNYLAGLTLMTLNDGRGENLIKLATSRIGVGVETGNA